MEAVTVESMQLLMQQTYAMVTTQKVFNTTKIDRDLISFSSWSPKKCSHFHLNVVVMLENLKLKYQCLLLLSSSRTDGEKMAACDRCNEWYHLSCDKSQQMSSRTPKIHGHAVNVIRLAYACYAHALD